MSEIDVKDLEIPEYAGPTPEANKIVLQVRRFPGQAPAEVTVDGSWTVAHVEQKLARQVWKANPKSVRLTLNGRPLPRDATIANLSPQIQGKVLDVVPEHPVGAGLEMAQLRISIPPDLYNDTDYSRLQAEIQDLPFKPEYGKKFKLTVKSQNLEDWLLPLLHISFRGRWYTYQLVLVGYPRHIAGYFEGAVPPCPLHGSKHPHVFDNGTFCWEIERRWQPGMMLYEDYIIFLFKTLENPQHHTGCGRR